MAGERYVPTPAECICSVCREQIISPNAWVDKEPPTGGCMFGHTAAHQCENAMNRAANAAALRKAAPYLFDAWGNRLPAERSDAGT